MPWYYRTGGETVYLCNRHPNGVTEAQYEGIRAGNPKAKGGGWRMMRRNPGVYVRGRVRHADHTTITLHGWHQVWPTSRPGWTRNVGSTPPGIDRKPWRSRIFNVTIDPLRLIVGERVRHGHSTAFFPSLRLRSSMSLHPGQEDHSDEGQRRPPPERRPRPEDLI